ncbi:MAG: carbon-nitrogen hydrolase family protein [Lewinella sp.]|nr:carbon-nitrogen hydrolase family protein [Lewinella sp.]
MQVAVVQSTPFFFDQARTLEKMGVLLAEIARGGAELVLFPESYLPGYPRGMSFGAVVGSRTPAGRALWQTYWEQSVPVPGPAVDRMAHWAKEFGCYLVVGVTERDEANGSLYCTMLYFSPYGGYLGKHRKLKPTGTERLIWAEGGADTLLTIRTPLGRLGGLICWENYMPLARLALFRQGVDIHLAPTADARPGWTATMQHVAMEGRCFVLSANQYLTAEDYPPAYRDQLSTPSAGDCRGGSVIIDPLGQILAGPLWDEEGILTAELDLDAVVRSRLDFAVAGHYARPDVFTFDVPGQPAQLVDGVE